MGATTYGVMAEHWPGASGPFAKPMNETPGLARVRRLGRDDDRRRRPGRGHHAAQARALRRIPARPRRGTVRPIAGRDRPDRRVPPSHPPGRPGRGRADLPRTAHHRADEHHRLQRRSRRPRLRGAPVIEPDRQPGSGRCHLAVTMAEHARPMTHMLRASRRAARARRMTATRARSGPALLSETLKPRLPLALLAGR